LHPFFFQSERDKYFVRKGWKEGREEGKKENADLKKAMADLKMLINGKMGTDDAMADRSRGWPATASSSLSSSDVAAADSRLLEEGDVLEGVLDMEDERKKQ